jgi:hypothetical protein
VVINYRGNQAAAEVAPRHRAHGGRGEILAFDVADELKSTKRSKISLTGIRKLILSSTTRA